MEFPRLRAPQNERAAFALLALAFHADKVLLGPWAAIRMHDVFDSDFFRYAQSAELLRRYGPFSWFPNFLGGMPAYAWHHTPFYALNLAALALPPWLIYHAMVVALMAGAGWGMRRFLHERWGVEPRTAFLGGVFFALVSQVQPNCIPETAFNYLFPLFYVWTLDVLERRGTRRVLAPLAGLAAILAVSYPVLTVPNFAVLHFAVLALDEKLGPRRARAAARALCVWAGYALCCLPVLYALWSYAPQAARRFDAWAFPGPSALADFARVFARLFLESSTRTATLAPLAAAGVLAARSPRVRRVLGLWAALLALAALCASQTKLLWAGTMLGKMDLGHFYWTVPFAAALAAALAADELIRRPERRAAARRAVWAASTLAAACAGLGLVSAPTLLLNLAEAAALTLWLAPDASALSPRRRPWAAAAAAALAVLAVRYDRAWGDEPERSPYHRTYEDYFPLGGLRAEAPGPWRAGAVSGVAPETLAGYGLETVDGRGPIMNRRYKDFFKLVVAPQLDDPARAAFFDSYWYDLYLDAGGPGRVPEFRLPLLALAGVRVLVSGGPLPQLAAAAESVRLAPSSDGLAALRWKDAAGRLSPWLEKALLRTFRLRPLYVYVLRDYFPRGFLADRAVVEKSDADVLSALSRATAPELRSTAFFSARDAGTRALPSWTGADAGKNGCRLAAYSPDRLEFDVTLTRPAVLVVSNNYHEYWTASVDAAPAPLLRADHAFQAVVLPKPGAHRVVLEFRDPGLAPSHAGLAAGALALLAPAL